MSLIPPIYDRTSADVAFAKQNQASLTDLKGALNPSDLNRIESNAEYLRTLLRDMGYYPQFESIVTDWQSDTDEAFEDRLNLANLQRIRKNIEQIHLQFDSSPLGVGSDNSLHYTEVNLWEQTQQTVVDRMEGVKKHYPQANAWVAGQRRK